MSNKNIKTIAEEITLPIIEQLGYELVDLEYKKEGPHWYLRIYIDKAGGISTDDCQKVSERISDVLDVKDPIPHSYFLEVSSIGLDRPLKRDEDFVRFKGHEVDVKLYKARSGKKDYTGELIGLIDNDILINVDGSIISFSRNQIAIVKLAIKF